MGKQESSSLPVLKLVAAFIFPQIYTNLFSVDFINMHWQIASHLLTDMNCAVSPCLDLSLRLKWISITPEKKKKKKVLVFTTCMCGTCVLFLYRDAVKVWNWGQGSLAPGRDTDLC